jgi:GT2 family glycosyltransferase/glycosyltransferase involved in cell wall biosynthesis
MPGRIRTPVGLFLYRCWYYGLHPKRWPGLARHGVRAVTPARIRQPVGRFLWRQAQWLRGRETGKRTATAAPEPTRPALTIPPDDPSTPIVFESVDRPVVSIVVPAHDNWRYTHLCLRAVSEHTGGPTYEVVLADDDSHDETATGGNVLEGVVHLADGIRRGYLESCNNAARYARGEFIVFLNNDTVVQPGWLEAMLELVRDGSVGVVGPKLVYEDGRLQEAGGIIWRDGSAENFGRDGDPDAPDVNYVKEVDYISGACMLVRASLWREIGGFDVRYSPGYYEDPDFAFEARRRGYRVVYQPRSVVVHFEGVSHGRDVTTGVKRFQSINRHAFQDKWSGQLESEQVDPGDRFLARDRSQATRRALVVDHDVPRPDCDAGSRFMDSYVRLLVDVGFRVTFVGDAFERPEPYTQSLQQYGVEVLYGRRCKDGIAQWIMQNGRYFDLVYLHKWFVAAKYVDLLREHSGARIVCCPADLHHVRERRHFAITRDAEVGVRARATEEAELALLGKVDLVHVLSTYEEELLLGAAPRASVRTIPVFFYDDPPPSDVPSFDDRRHVMFVGGYAHAPNIDAVVWFAEEVLPSVREQLADALFYVVGSNPPAEVEALAGDRIVVTGQVTERALRELYRQVRLVVCPLRFGAGVKGKLVEALYHQVPAVVTSVAAEGLPGVERHVLIADDAEEFARRVVELYTSRQLWSQLSERAAGYVAARFSRAAALAAIEDDLLALKRARVAVEARAGDRASL